MATPLQYNMQIKRTLQYKSQVTRKGCVLVDNIPVINADAIYRWKNKRGNRITREDYVVNVL